MTKTRSAPNTTATERVYRAIRRNILEGVYDGEQFLREEGLAREFQISRTPIREALRRLVSEGWLEQIPHRGARVVEWTRDDADEVFELRSILESHAVRRAATRMEPREIARLRHLVEAMESLHSGQPGESREDIATLNDQFHQAILESAGSRRLQRLVNAIVQAPMTTRSFHRYNAGEMARSMTQHREILQAIEARDPVWAAAVMRSHILAARPAHHRSDATPADPSRE